MRIERNFVTRLFEIGSDGTERLVSEQNMRSVSIDFMQDTLQITWQIHSSVLTCDHKVTRE